MNFFEQQRLCKKNTNYLLVMFFVAVGVTAGLTAYLFFLIFQSQGIESDAAPYEFMASKINHFYSYDSFWGAFAVVALILMMASMIRSYSLSGGGKVVAQMVGAVPAHTLKEDLLVKRYMNVVEEMSIASGVPIPEIYVQDREESINAFAAGTHFNNAVVCVTRGSLNKLNREELQAVVGHEFSHILNGDMKLNIRLIGYVFGLTMVFEGGRIILRSISRSSRSSRGKGGPVQLFLLALALMIIGGLGMLFASFIKARISRQREYLADAAALQFTRNPQALTGVFKKLWVVGSYIWAPRASEANHMFFGEALKSRFNFSTHPPILDRIKAVDPKFTEERLKFEEDGIYNSLNTTEQINLSLNEPVAKDPDKSQGQSIESFVQLASVELLRNSMGSIDPTSFEKSEKIIEGIPQTIHDELRTTQGAYGFLFSNCTSSKVNEDEITRIFKSYKVSLQFQDLVNWSFKIKQLGENQRFASLKIAVNTLKNLEHDQIRSLLSAFYAVARADKKITRVEMSTLMYLAMQLKPRLGAMKYPNMNSNQAKAIMLSYIAKMHDGNNGEAFRFISDTYFSGSLKLVTQYDSFTLIDSLTVLTRLNLKKKENFISAVIKLVHADGRIKTSEFEMVQLLSECLDVPMPMLNGAV